MIFCWIQKIFFWIVFSLSAGCKLSEFLCNNGRCILTTRFCDGTNDCGDESDEPRFCTPCNRTYFGDVGKTYEVEIHRPKEDKLPFICHLSFSAEDEDFGDIVQLTFDSFTMGSFTSFTKDGCPDGFLEIVESNRPRVGGKWCGTSWGPTLYYSETKKITLILHLLRLSSDQSGYNFDIRIYYKMLQKKAAVVRYGGVTPNIFLSSVNKNVSSSFGPSTSTYSTHFFLGELIPGTYCSRIYSDCNEKPCRLQSPNFPGVYPRNVTCYYAVRQHQIPPGKHAVISVRQPNGQLVAIRSSTSLYTRSAQQQAEHQFGKLEVWSDCDEVQDYVTIYDGYTTRDSPLLKFCGSREPVPEVISSGPELLVEFTTSPYGTFLFPGTPQSFHGFELEVKVHFLDQESVAYTRNKRCEFSLKGTSKGILESPRHSLTPNTTCTYYLEGGDPTKLTPTFKPSSGRFDYKFWHKQLPQAPPRYKVWLSILKFKVSPPLVSTEEPCAVRLQVWDGNFRDPTCYEGICEKDKHRLIAAKKSNVTLLAKYCRDRISRTCDHELLGNGTRRPRPCAPTESFLSSGNSMTLQLKLQEATALRHVSFKALYEFVDLHQDGEEYGEGQCSRKFISRSHGQQPSTVQKFQSPRDVFMFGRGGNTNLSCVYRFEGRKDERLKISIQNVETGTRPCKSLYHVDINRVLCHGNLSASLRIFEYSGSFSIPKDCLCSGGDGITPFNFVSTGNIVEVHFQVLNMSSMDDFKSFSFEGSWEFIRQPACARTQQMRGSSGEIRLSSPSRTVEDLNCEYQPWIIEPSKGKYLYVTAHGLPIDKSLLTYEDALSNTSWSSLNIKCGTKNRLIMYTGGALHSVVCPDPLGSDKNSVAEVFSNGWRSESEYLEDVTLSLLEDDESEKVKLTKSIMIEYLGKESGRYSVSWLELGRRKSILPPEGYVMKDCIHKCPELDACINSSLWCDGTIHCPSGYDESLSHCYLIFQLPALYLAFGIIALICLVTVVAVATFRSCVNRRERAKSHLTVLPSDSSLFEEKEVIC